MKKKKYRIIKIRYIEKYIDRGSVLDRIIKTTYNIEYRFLFFMWVCICSCENKDTVIRYKRFLEALQNER